MEVLFWGLLAVAIGAALVLYWVHKKPASVQKVADETAEKINSLKKKK